VFAGNALLLMFAGNALLLMFTLSAMAKRPAIPRHFRAAGAMLVLAHAFTVLTAVMWVPAYTATHNVRHAGMLTYVRILLLGNFDVISSAPPNVAQQNRWTPWATVLVIAFALGSLLVQRRRDVQ